MTRHVLLGYFGDKDRQKRRESSGERPTPFDLVASGRLLDHGIGGALSALHAKKVFPTEVALDVLILAAHIYAADTRISRSTQSQDSWTREITLVVPVSDVARWDGTKNILQKMLNFLTGDRWEIEFRHRPADYDQLTQQPSELIGPPFDLVSLFSGGLDSMIGAIDRLEEGRTPLLVSHAGEGAVSKAQDRCFEFLKAKYKQPFDRFRTWMSFPKKFIPAVGPEDSTRGRSFLFFSLGIFAGAGLRKNFTLHAPENGLIALNVPLDNLRLGALSTRTTHPFYITCWNELLVLLGIPGNIENPYWSKTKGEMVSETANGDMLNKILTETLSCASPTKGRWKGLGTQHCGYCLPCLIRRASLASLKDKTVYTVPDLKAKTWNSRGATAEQIRSFQFAIARLRGRPGIENILIHKPGPLTKDPKILKELASVYKRGLDEVDRLLKGVNTRPL